MRCPYCANDDTQVKDSRPTEDSSAIRRRRICNACGGRFTTFERVQLRELTVIKKSGRKVPFDREKLAHAAPGAKVMHPGPMNRGVEIDSDVADDLSVSLIQDQVEMGVAVRMAVLASLAARLDND